MPPYLGFFAGKRFVPIATAFAAIGLGILLSFVWPPIGAGIKGFSHRPASAPAGIVSKLRDPEAACKARDLIAALGGAGNIQRVDACAETRLRLVIGDDGPVNEAALRVAGVAGVMRLANRTLHLVVGLNADQFAVEMRGQLATS